MKNEFLKNLIKSTLKPIKLSNGLENQNRNWNYYDFKAWFYPKNVKFFMKNFLHNDSNFVNNVNWQINSIRSVIDVFTSKVYSL